MTTFGDDYAEWSRQEQEIFDSLIRGHEDLRDDEDLQFYFHEAMFDQGMWTEGRLDTRADFEDQLIDWLDAHEIDFWEMFDWEAYQEWYDSQ